MERVPDNVKDLIIVFLKHPTSISVQTFLFYLFYKNTFVYNDLIIYPSMFMYWTFNEWFIHKYLFHTHFNWIGKKYHIDHHKKTYYHVCFDNVILIWIWIGFYYNLFYYSLILINKHNYTNNVMIPYVLSGYMYMFFHYSAHCKYIPKNYYWRTIIEHHKKHHKINPSKNFSFILPFFDTIFNTNIIQ